MASLRKLFLDGLLIAVPLACLAVLAVHVVKFFREVVRPLLPFLPFQSLPGVVGLTLAAILAVVVLILLFGLVVRWRARRVLEAFEKKVLNRIPLYTVLKRISADVVDPEGMHHAVLVDLHATGDASLGLLVEEIDAGRVVVFLPHAPSAMTGTVHVVPRDRVSNLAASGDEVIDVLGNRGLEASELLRRGTP